MAEITSKVWMLVPYVLGLAVRYARVYSKDENSIFFYRTFIHTCSVVRDFQPTLYERRKVKIVLYAIITVLLWVARCTLKTLNSSFVSASGRLRQPVYHTQIFCLNQCLE